MMFSVETGDVSLLSTLGVPGLLFVIVVLAGIVALLYKDGKSKDKQLLDLYESRLQDAKDTRDKISEPLEQQALLSKQIYDIVIANTSRRR